MAIYFKTVPVVIAMLRGINLMRHNRIKMEELRELCGTLKLCDARTYVQSGNVVFRTNEKNLPLLAKRIQQGIEKKFGFKPQVFLRTTAEMREVLRNNPFADRKQIEPSKLLVNFLTDELPVDIRAAVKAIPCDPEEICVGARELYIYFPNGQGQSKIAWAVIERKMKTVGTARNWNSVTNLLKMAEEMETAESAG